MTATIAPRTRTGWARLGAWVALTYLGFAMFGDIHLPIIGPTTTLDPADIDAGSTITGFAFGALSGALVASLQWIVLRSWAPRARGWIPWTAVGFGLAHSLNDMVPYRPFDLLVMLLIGGVVIGVLQAIALRRALPMPWVWIVVAVFAWVVGWTVGAQVIYHIYKNPLAELFVGHGSTGLIIGAITGVVFLAHLGPGQAAMQGRAGTDLESPTP